MSMGDQLKHEAERARHDILGWKNLTFGWTAWSGLGQDVRQSVSEVKHLLQSVGRAIGGGPVIPETFDQAVGRFRLTADKLKHLESHLRLRAAWWFLAAMVAFASLALAPLTPHSFGHALVATALMFLCLTRSVSWYFRACQVHDRKLYDFGSWWRSNKAVKRTLTALVALLAVVLLLAVGAAHATTPVQGFAPDPEDPSVGALREVFGGIVDTVLGQGDPNKDAKDSALGAMMVPFNSAILFITMVFAGYASMRAIIDTAHSGQFMGKQKDVSGYVVGRIALGVGLLVPLGSGYSLIQYGMMWWSLQGAGLANQVNSAALDYMGGHKENMIAEPRVPSAESFVRNALKAQVCMAAMNQQYQAAGDDTRIQMKVSIFQLKPAEQGWWDRTKGQLSFDAADSQSRSMLANMMPITQIKSFVGNIFEYNKYREQWESSHTYNAYRFSFDAVNSNYTNPEGVCGAFTFSNPVQNDMNESAITQSIVDAQTQAVRSIMASPSLSSLATTIASADGSSSSNDTRVAIHTQIQQLANTYSSAVVQAVESQGGIAGMSNADWQRFVSTMKQTGWAYLPSYYNQMIRANDNVQMALNAMPEFSFARVTAFASDAELTTYNDAMTRLDEFLQTPGDLIMANAQKVGGINFNQSWWDDIRDQCVMKTEDAEKAKNAAVSNSSADSMYSHTQKCISVPARRGLFAITSSLMGGNLNHIVHIKAIGDTIIGIGDGLVMANFMAHFITGNIAGNVIGAGSAVQSLGGLLTAMAFAILTFGAVAAYYIPLIPYINGTIAFVKWLTLAIESIIAGPIFAAAHAFPEGHDVSGSAGPGYRLLLGLILRPALTVIGFFLAIIVAQPVADYINVTFGNAIMGAEAGSMTGLTSLVAYIAIYVTMMTTVMHSVFSLINWVPDNVLRWVGAGLQAHGVGDQESGEMKGNVLAAFRGGTHITSSAKPKRPKIDKPKGDKEKKGKEDDFGDDEVR